MDWVGDFDPGGVVPPGGGGRKISSSSSRSSRSEWRNSVSSLAEITEEFESLAEFWCWSSGLPEDEGAWMEESGVPLLFVDLADLWESSEEVLLCRALLGMGLKKLIC